VSALGPKSDVVSGARDLLISKNRRIRGQFLVEGAPGVDAALSASMVSSLFVVDWDHELAIDARRLGVRVNLVTSPAMEALSETKSPQGVVAVCAIPNHSLEDVLNTKPQTIAVCAGVSDPGNLGTIIRTAAAVGADAVITTSGSVDVWSGKVVRATAGNFANIAIISGIDDSQLKSSLQSHNLQILATTGLASHALFDAEVVSAMNSPHAWVFGNEAHGLSDVWVYDGVMTVRIPMKTEVESLNVSAAAAVCLFASQFAARFSS
jgi:TrmH family RNA methyltransferase